MFGETVILTARSIGFRVRHGLPIILILGVLITGFSFISAPTPRLRAASNQTLATTYAPELIFAKGEKFYPTSVEYLLSNSILKQRVNGSTPITIDGSPTASTLGTHNGTDLYLDNKLGTFDAIATDYAAKASQIGYYVYVHFINSSGGTTIQYWLFYAFNNGPLNDHQGDLEVVEIFLDSTGTPQTALYSQHFAGENAHWSDVETYQTTHPVVYVAQGSHANYFRSYQGRIGIENDIVGNDGLVITPSQLTLVTLGERGSGNHPASQSWLDYRGRWGYWGTDLEVAQGKAGPLGPVDNQDGIRWSQPSAYLSQTFAVNANYFYLAWIAANFLLIFIVYAVIRGAWKVVGIVRRYRSGGLLVGGFLKGRGGLSVALVVGAILLTIAALALPWYTVTSSSQSGPLAGQGKVGLVSIDGLNGVSVNLFNGVTSETTAGYSHLLSTQIPFYIIFAVGLVLLALSIIGVKSGKKMRWSFILGAILSLTPFILIYVFMTQLPALLPWASQLVPGQTIPPQVGQVVQTIASNPIGGTTTQTFPVVGSTQVDWGFGIAVYLFLIAAVLRIAAGVIVSGVPDLTPPAAPAVPASNVQPPPPTK